MIYSRSLKCRHCVCVSFCSTPSSMFVVPVAPESNESCFFLTGRVSQVMPKVAYFTRPPIAVEPQITYFTWCGPGRPERSHRAARRSQKGPERQSEAFWSRLGRKNAGFAKLCVAKAAKIRCFASGCAVFIVNYDRSRG